LKFRRELNTIKLKYVVSQCVYTVMEYEAHRLRFADWQPSAIKSICCDAASERLAVGREDGEIEIFDYKVS
jgi:hypothetical protein